MSFFSKSSSDCSLGLTGGETKALLLGVFATGERGKIDYEKVAEKGGWKNSHTAAAIYYAAKRKLMELMADSEGDVFAKRAPTKRKARAKAGQDDADANATVLAGGVFVDAPRKRQCRIPTKRDTAVKLNETEVQACDTDGGDADEDAPSADHLMSTAKAQPGHRVSKAKLDDGWLSGIDYTEHDFVPSLAYTGESESMDFPQG